MLGYLLGYCHLGPANLFFLVFLSFTPGSIKTFLFLAEHAIVQYQILQPLATQGPRTSSRCLARDVERHAVSQTPSQTPQITICTFTWPPFDSCAHYIWELLLLDSMWVNGWGKTVSLTLYPCMEWSGQWEYLQAKKWNRNGWCQKCLLHAHKFADTLMAIIYVKEKQVRGKNNKWTRRQNLGDIKWFFKKKIGGIE